MITALTSALLKSLKPPELSRVSEWANKYRRLSTEASAAAGSFDINVTPFMREVVDSFGDPRIPEVRLMKSSQIAYSENLNNAIGRQIHQDPCPIMMIQPTLEMGEGYSKDRIQTMIRDCPELDALVDARNSTILQKRFPGGFLQIVGGNSPASLASRPIRIVIIDEEDRTAQSAGKEGDPEKLATARQITFYNKKLIAGGTPVVKGASKTERGFLKGDQRRYKVECPHCNTHISLEWEQFQKNPDKPNYAEHKCQNCSEYIHAKYKAGMVRDKLAGGTAFWEPQEKRVSYTWDDELGTYLEETPIVRSYYVWSAYSPFKTWRELCDDYNDAKGDPELLQTFYNTLIGLPYEHVTHDLDFQELYRRRETLDHENLPKECLVVTAGIDTQDNRFEYKTVAWGVGEESWILEYGTIEGDPADEETRSRLWEFIREREYKTENDKTLRIRGAFIDSGGHRTDSVYTFTKGKQHVHIFACKGLNTAGNPIFSGYSDQKAAKVRLARVGTDTAKEQIYAKLAKDDHEPGQIHFDDRLPLSYFEGLISEERVVELSRGQPIIRYKKKNAAIRNEPLDCFVYAYACLRSMKLQLRKQSRRMILKQREAAKIAREAAEQTEGEQGAKDANTETEPEETPQKEKKKVPAKRKAVKMLRGKNGRRRR